MFKDHFSGHAVDYSAFRPAYPEALFRWLAVNCRERRCAWDCATGNGQAAVSLAGFAGYLGTWSAVRRYHQETGKQPLDLVHGDLNDAWGDPLEARTISWRLNVRAGFKQAKRQAQHGPG